MDEIWKNIKNYEGYYQASNLGRIRSIDRIINEKNGKKRMQKGRLLKFSINKKGYFVSAFSKNGNVKSIRVHRIIAETFIMNNKPNLEVNHIDENKLNNEVGNLEWITHIDNIRHGSGIKRSSISRIGKANSWGEKTGTSKLSEKMVINIFKDKRKYLEISKEYNIGIAQISRIKNKKNWIRTLKYL